MRKFTLVLVSGLAIDKSPQGRVIPLPNVNVLALGAEYISVNEAICILRMIFATEFEGGRHNERLNMIKDIEKDNMK